MDIKNSVAVVTGGGSGIGESLCHAFAAGGARHVVAIDLDGDGAREVANAIGGSSCTAEGVELDVSNEQGIADLVSDIEDAHGPIGVFCSNAGFVTTGGVEESNDIISSMWDVHVLSHIYAARAVLPSMIAAGQGHLLNTASAAGLLSQIGSMSYTVTKHAAVGLAEWLAITHHHQGIGVSVLCPQAVRTNILANSPDNRDVSSIDDIDGGVAGGDGVLEPGEVAQQCLDAIANDRFWVLPHPEVAEYVTRKATDVERWLNGMRRFQAAIYQDQPLPGDGIAPDV